MITRAESPSSRRPLSTSAWLLALTLALLGFGFVTSRPTAPPDQVRLTGGAAAAQRAIDALVHPGPQATALSLLPADFTQVTGIVPGAIPGRDGTVRAVHVDGGCSAPWGDDNTKWDYSVPCKAHDLGYDLLRYADKVGRPLPSSARASLDARLSADMHAMCRINPNGSAHTCQLVASLYTAGLVVNSWHQRWGPPVGDPIGPMLAGIAVIGCLLVLRLRDWHTRRRTRPAPDQAPGPAPGPRPAFTSPWMTLCAAGLILLTLGESLIALARWAGASEAVLAPFTWLAQLSPLFFFAGGRANAAGWQAVTGAGGGYRQYLAHRASSVLRPALVFVVVASAVPLALELLGIPDGTNAAVVRLALHPLWLLGVYLLTVVATPVMLALHRRAAVLTRLGLLAFLLSAEFAAGWVSSPVPRYLAVFALALLAQQVAFGGLPLRRPARLVTGVAVGLAGLVLLTTAGGFSPTLIDTPGALPALAAPALPVLLLGLVQLCLLGLFARPLARLTRRRALAVPVRFALRAPMSLYLAFLAAMLLLVTIVSRPAATLAWLLGPRTLVALGLLAVPALLVFWWFERHGDGHVPWHHHRPSGWLAHAATALGIGFATIGLFGFALTRFGGDGGQTLLGLPLDPIQNLIQLLLGVFLLHAVRTGASAAASTWVVTAMACVPPLLEAADGYHGEVVTVAVNGATAVFALLCAAGALLPARTVIENR
ncbi:phospholipase [Amycolatopsis rhizosphaerae]|uniref:Phospholipase n=1 Tax=Amycolatopsis rhizosphaerae TaxID=2053003 RepID=A0A558BQN6_9PSEU|nr:phospholipase A2 [Amycolatopsis rhizosphaerae]TVT38812.1 phospholipase [Amycolatopsis rhizosphaerae]